MAHGESVDWPALDFTPIVTNTFNAPTAIAHAGDHSQRLFITEKSGYVRIIQSSNALEKPFLNITNRVLSAGTEQGLLGVAFPPEFKTKSHFYVNYTRQPDGAVVISRFSLTADANIADADSEEIIKVLPKPSAFHNGGQIAFGPDGYLYIGTGDGGSTFLNHAQNPSSWLGKVLRVDVEAGVSPYAVPTNNPFVSTPGFLPEIWAFGLRNPWRFSFDRETGDLYIADVGEFFKEEINFQPAGNSGGQNFGWQLMEGSLTASLPGALFALNTLTPPVIDYDRELGGCVIGGYVCRATGSGRLQGIYVFGDFVSKRIFGLKFAQSWQMATLASGITVSAFGEDEAGELYAADYATGKILRISDNGVVATPSFNPPAGNSPSDHITLSSLTTNSFIRYTLAARDPDESDPLVATGTQILITNGTTIRAQAFRADLPPSIVSTGTFNFVVAPPQINGLPSSITGISLPTNSLITLTCATPSAAIYYTIGFSPITTNSTRYTGPFLFTPTSSPQSKQLQARAFAPGFASDSQVRSLTISPASVPSPSISPITGPFTNATQIAVTNGAQIRMACAYSDAEIFYTLDGTDPNTSSMKFVAPFTIHTNTRVKAKAFLARYQASSITDISFSVLQTTTPLTIESVSVLSDKTTQIRWASEASKTYIVKYSDDLVTWNTLGDPVTGNGSLVSFTDSTPVADVQRRFYRVFLVRP